ncbi:MAG: circularly permuted type 2 ATP-grasp protein [Brachybacterium alimentarium]|uniref:circularly permuted type 2 ATP-grasp protein n=1 Tax=Brachybacterium alimentarium TaxID=47845 RepID=UPI0015F01470|nr:circularly permuted type 2 ATP-grasp protein [Brachybacterium alimentarium]
MSIAPPTALADELAALGPVGRSRAATSAARMFAADVSVAPPRIDPVPVVLDAEEWETLSSGLVQRMRLLDALYADLYGPRTVLGTDVAPAAELLQDPAYLRSAIGIPSAGSAHLFALSCVVSRTEEGSWVVHEDHLDVPEGAGTALELRRVLSRCAPTLYGSTALRRLHPFFDTVRTALHHRSRAEGRAGRTVVLTDTDPEDPLRAFDHSWLANLLGAPLVSVDDLRTGSGTLTLRRPGLESDSGDTVDSLVRLLPSHLLDPLDLGPTPYGGVTGLVEAARCGDLQMLNPFGTGLLENPALRATLPDLCRQILHEDLQLRPAGPADPTGPAGPAGPAESPGPPGSADSPGQAGQAPMGAGWLSVDPHGGDQLVERPVRLQLLVIASEDGFDVLPGGVARTADDGPEALKDICVAVPEPSSLPDDPRDLQEPRPDDSALNGSTLEMSAQGNGGPASHGVLAAPPAMTRSIGSDLFWFGRYLERVDSTARLLRTVLDTSNDLGSEHSRAATTAQAVLLGAVTHVTTTYPGFQALDPTDPDAVHREILSLLTDAGRPGSLAQSYSSLAHTTRTLRDLVSDDVWPIIARMRGSFGTLNGSDLQPLEQGLTDVVDGCLTLSGAVADSMPRNLGWDFTEAGRKLERTMGLLALLRVALGHRRSRAAEIRIATAIAQITESGASYRRSFHAAVQPELLLELLLHDTTLPRSIAFQIERLGSTLDRLPEVEPAPELRAPWTSLRSRIASWEPRSLLRPGSGMLVEGGESGGAPTAMLAEVDAAIASLRELATALEDHYFRPSEATSRWGIDDV